MKSPQILSALAAALAVAAFVGCQSVDESAPSHPRVANFLTPDQKAKDNAEHRELEPPKREMPTGTGREFPGQSLAPASPAIITAAGFGAPGALRTGFRPHLHTQAKNAPAVGETLVPGVQYPVEHSWGQVLPLAEYRHRPWPNTSVTFLSPGTEGNPTYFAPISAKCSRLNNGTTLADIGATAVDPIWGVGEILFLPVNMCLQCPLARVRSVDPYAAPNYAGFLPQPGPVDPAPYPGTIAWTYSWQNASQPSTVPATTGSGLQPQEHP